MPTYYYKAINEKGVIVRNRVEESSKLILVKKLKSNGLFPIAVTQAVARNTKKVRKKKNTSNLQDIIRTINTSEINVSGSKRKSFVQTINNYIAKQEKITFRDIMIFTQNFYLLKKANFNNVHALSTIIESTENMALAGILEDILAGVEEGDYMYKTMEYYSSVFPYIYTNMIKVGELSGSLENALEQAVEYLDNSNDITFKLKRILIPNIAQLVLILVAMVVGTLYAIPLIQNLFDELGASTQLPAMTIAFQKLLQFIMKYWQLPTIIIVSAIVALILYIRTPKGRYRFDYFKYTMPVFGKLIFSLDMSRMMKAMLLNLRNGMRIQDAIDVSKNVVNNYVMLSIIERSLNNILIGESWIEPFESSGLTSAMITEMLKIGMQTDLTEMMEKLVEYMEFDINVSIEKITMILPQIMYGIVGVVLIFFVLVVLVPFIQVYMGNFLFDAYDV